MKTKSTCKSSIQQTRGETSKAHEFQIARKPIRRSLASKEGAETHNTFEVLEAVNDERSEDVEAQEVVAKIGQGVENSKGDALLVGLVKCGSGGMPWGGRPPAAYG